MCSFVNSKNDHSLVCCAMDNIDIKERHRKIRAIKDASKRREKEYCIYATELCTAESDPRGVSYTLSHKITPTASIMRDISLMYGYNEPFSDPAGNVNSYLPTVSTSYADTYRYKSGTFSGNFFSLKPCIRTISTDTTMNRLIQTVSRNFRVSQIHARKCMLSMLHRKYGRFAEIAARPGYVVCPPVDEIALLNESFHDETMLRPPSRDDCITSVISDFVIKRSSIERCYVELHKMMVESSVFLPEEIIDMILRYAAYEADVLSFAYGTPVKETRVSDDPKTSNTYLTQDLRLSLVDLHDYMFVPIKLRHSPGFCNEDYGIYSYCMDTGKYGDKTFFIPIARHNKKNTFKYKATLPNN